MAQRAGAYFWSLNKNMVKQRIQIIAVGGLIVNKNNEVLLTQRNEQEFPIWDGKWGIPGGHLEFGDNPEERLMTELKEELGVEVRILTKTPFLTSYVFRTDKMIYHAILLCYLTQIIRGQPKIANQENRDFKWFKPEKINFKDCLPSTDIFISQLPPGVKTR